HERLGVCGANVLDAFPHERFEVLHLVVVLRARTCFNVVSLLLAPALCDLAEGGLPWVELAPFSIDGYGHTRDVGFLLGVPRAVDPSTHGVMHLNLERPAA